MPVLTRVLIFFLTDKVIREVILAKIKQLAARTDNKIDDAIVRVIEEALNA